jgi:hypothetical protein
MGLSRSSERRKSNRTIRKTQNLTPDSVSNNLSEQHFTSTLTTPYVAQVRSERILDFQEEYQMTIRVRKKLDSHQASMVLMCLIVKVIQLGFDFSAALSMDFLYLKVMGSKEFPEQIRDEKIRKTAMLAKLLISYQQGSWLTFTERERIPKEVLQTIRESGWLPSQRTLASWRNFWEPESFLELRFVRLESLIENHESNTEPYSSYTKGYGNGGKVSRIKKTRYDSELDGETTDRPETEIPLLEFEKYNTIQIAIESARAKKIQK